MIGKILVELRKKSKLTQEELTKKLGIHRGTYANYEIGKREPDIETLQKIADFYGVTLDYLTGRTTDLSTERLQSTYGRANPEENLSKDGVAKLSLLDLERAVEMIERGEAHFGGHELTEEDREFIAKMIRLAIDRKHKRNKKD